MMSSACPAGWLSLLMQQQRMQLDLEREVVACRPRVPDHEELVQEAATSKILSRCEAGKRKERRKTQRFDRKTSI